MSPEIDHAERFSPGYIQGSCAEPDVKFVGTQRLLCKILSRRHRLHFQFG